VDRVGLDVVSNLYRFGEAVAGSVEERRSVEIIRGFLEELCDNVEVEFVPVTSWSEQLCTLEVDGYRVRCSAHPPTESVDVESEAVVLSIDDVFRGKLEEVRDRIAVVTGVEDPDDVAEATAILGGLGARAAVYVDRYEAYRRVVVCSYAIPNYVSSSAAIPAVHVPRSALKLIVRGSRLRIYVRARARRGHGMNVLGDLFGSREELIYVSAHHDHWFWGCVDDLVGVAVALGVARDVAGRRMRKGVRIAIFGAEEGLPETLSPFYWAVGSRMHVLRSWRRVGDRIELVLNIDVPYGTPRLAATGLEALGISRYLGLEVDSYGFIYDTFPFAALGVPTITIENFEKVLSSGIYHSTLDDIAALDAATYRGSLETAIRILRLVDRFDAARFADLGLLEAAQQLVNRGAIQSIAMRGVERCLSYGVSKEVLRVVNSAIFGYAIDRSFLTRPGVREIGGVVPWGPDTVEVPTGMDIKGWRRAYEKALSILNSIYFACRGS